MMAFADAMPLTIVTDRDLTLDAQHNALDLLIRTEETHQGPFSNRLPS